MVQATKCRGILSRREAPNTLGVEPVKDNVTGRTLNTPVILDARLDRSNLGCGPDGKYYTPLQD